MLRRRWRTRPAYVEALEDEKANDTGRLPSSSCFALNCCYALKGLRPRVDANGLAGDLSAAHAIACALGIVI